MTTRRGALRGVLPLLAQIPGMERAGAGAAGPSFPGNSGERYERDITLRNAAGPAFALFHHDGVVMDFG